LSPKPVKSCHEKLLDPARNPVTNFQVKPAKNSGILLKNYYFWGVENKLVKLQWHTQKMSWGSFI